MSSPKSQSPSLKSSLKSQTPSLKSSLKSQVQMGKSDQVSWTNWISWANNHTALKSARKKFNVLNKILKNCILLKYRNLNYIVTWFSLRLGLVIQVIGCKFRVKSKSQSPSHKSSLKSKSSSLKSSLKSQNYRLESQVTDSSPTALIYSISMSQSMSHKYNNRIIIS